MAPGARNKFRAPAFEPEIFRKQMYLYWRKCLWHCCDFLGPRSDSAYGQLFPLAPPSLYPGWCAIKIGNFSENEQIFKSERHELLFQEHLQFSNTIRHGSCTDCQQRLLAASQVFSCSFCVTARPAPHVLSAWTCVCFANDKTLPTFKKLLFKGKISLRTISELFWRQRLLQKRPSKPGLWWECDLAKMSVVINRVCKKVTWEVRSSLLCSQYTFGWTRPWLPPKKILDPSMLLQLKQQTTTMLLQVYLKFWHNFLFFAMSYVIMLFCPVLDDWKCARCGIALDVEADP